MRRTCGLLLVLAGCIEYEKGSTGGDETGDPSTESATADSSVDSSATSSVTSSASASPTSSGAEETGDETTGGDPIDGQCDVFEQNCPDGSKCMPVDTDQDGIHDASKCVPLKALPGVPGDDCEVEGSPASGIDDCGIAAICWGVDDSNKGVCVEMCHGSLDHPTCPDGLICDISNGANLILCLTACDPLSPTCPEGKVCIPGSEGVFLCDTDASGTKGAYGDECEYLNVCDNGLICMAGDLVPGCLTPGCCTEYCELNTENNCTGAPKQECVPFYDDLNDAPPGFEDVGVCAIPMG